MNRKSARVLRKFARNLHVCCARAAVEGGPWLPTSGRGCVNSKMLRLAIEEDFRDDIEDVVGIAVKESIASSLLDAVLDVSRKGGASVMVLKFGWIESDVL